MTTTDDTREMLKAELKSMPNGAAARLSNIQMTAGTSIPPRNTSAWLRP
jgi:hypothetical protein